MKKRIFLLLICIAIASLIPANLTAQETEDRSGFFVYPSLSTWGLGATAGYRFADLITQNMDTIAYAGLEGGYFSGSYYRLPDGTIYSSPSGGFDADSPYYSYWQAGWQAGLKQTFLSDNNHDYIGINLEYNGELRNNTKDKNNLIFSSSIPEKNGSLTNELKATLFINYKTPHFLHQYKQGPYAQLWFRSVPPNMGSTDSGQLSYSAAGLEASYNLTILDSDPNGDEFCIIFAAHAGGEHIYGSAIPFYQKGFAQDYIRGADGHGLDSTNSIAANAELRFYLPSPGIVSNLTIWPVLYIFSDNGLFWSDDPAKSLQVSTAGIGFALDLAPALVLTVSTQWRLTDSNIDGSIWSPISMSLGSYLF